MSDEPPTKRQKTGGDGLAKDSLTGDPSSWNGKSLASVEQISPAGLTLVMDYADKFRHLVEHGSGACEILKGKIMAAVFYEASTRTNCSFQAAMLRLGGTVIPVDSTSSSVKKGETLSDTIKCMECYCDVLVLRHPVKGSATEAATAASIPVLNAGDGTGEHPTQALLDLYTIRAELGSGAPAGKNVTLVGDLKNGRTVHSLAMLISRGDFKGVRLCYVSPAELKMPDYVKDHISSTSSVEQEESEDIAKALETADVVYMTRVQVWLSLLCSCMQCSSTA